MERRDVEARVAAAMAVQFGIDADAPLGQKRLDRRRPPVCARERESGHDVLARGTGHEPLDLVDAAQTGRALEIEGCTAARQVLRRLRLPVCQAALHEE